MPKTRQIGQQFQQTKAEHCVLLAISEFHWNYLAILNIQVNCMRFFYLYIHLYMISNYYVCIIFLWMCIQTVVNEMFLSSI